MNTLLEMNDESGYLLQRGRLFSKLQDFKLFRFDSM